MLLRKLFRPPELDVVDHRFRIGAGVLAVGGDAQRETIRNLPEFYLQVLIEVDLFGVPGVELVLLIAERAPVDGDQPVVDRLAGQVLRGDGLPGVGAAGLPEASVADVDGDALIGYFARSIPEMSAMMTPVAFGERMTSTGWPSSGSFSMA